MKRATKALLAAGAVIAAGAITVELLHRSGYKRVGPLKELVKEPADWLRRVWTGTSLSSERQQEIMDYVHEHLQGNVDPAVVRAQKKWKVERSYPVNIPEDDPRQPTPKPQPDSPTAERAVLQSLSRAVPEAEKESA